MLHQARAFLPFVPFARRLPWSLALILAASGVVHSVKAQDVDYQRDVRPILSQACFSCHGPDEAHRQAGLRLDTLSGATDDLNGSPAVVPGHPAASELLIRVASEDPDVRMPPQNAGEPLSTDQIAILRQWIAGGANWGEHWAFVPPRKAAIPETSREDLVHQGRHDWVLSPIDAFILRSLQAANLVPEPTAARATLLRRLSLDLIGLPPTLDEIDAFISDRSVNAYQRQVDRLLASPHYGERWGRVWLDAARYADSDGFEKDKPRSVWMYRDWVVKALNADLPYDEFLIDQIAGDLRESPTQDQIVATGFLRNSMLNEEGGVDPEQFRMEAMFDRMDAVGKSILGLTLQCAQCHSHKYDPLTQTDYYRMFALLNNSHEACVTVYPESELEQRNAILERISEIEERVKARNPDWQSRLARWARRVQQRQPDWAVLRLEHEGDNAQRYNRQADGSLRAAGYAPTKLEAVFATTVDLPEIRAFRLEALTDPNLPAGGPGRAVNGLFALSEFKVQAQSVQDPTLSRWVTFSRSSTDFANAPKTLPPPYTDQEGRSGRTGPVSWAVDGLTETAWGIDAGAGRRNRSRQAVFVSDSNSAFDGGTKLRVHLVQKHGGWNSDDNQNLNLGRFRVSVAAAVDVPDQLVSLEAMQILQSLAKSDPGEWTSSDYDRLFDEFRSSVAEWDEANAEIERLWDQHPEGVTQLVLRERSRPRTTHRLERGDFLKPLDPVSGDVPEFLHPLNVDEPTRMDFARWLVDRRSPTTARAIVNRVWQAHFGRGLVDTAEDLGIQGDLPSHPELLDWLAVDFMENDWSLKHLHRQIVSSATYRQSSRVSPRKLTMDPYNRLLSRGPRFRVDAEVVRDIALTASNLLNRNIGGPPVYPPAPEYLFRPPASYGPKSWETSTGADRFRRALYTFRFRSVPYPALQAFDAPNADIACVRRTRSNTPLQALATLNEPLFLQCARALGQRTLEECGSSDIERLVFAFRTCLSRVPTAQEQEVMVAALNDVREQLAADPELAVALSGTDSYERSQLSGETTKIDVAVWTAMGRILLNLDETISLE